MKVMKANEAKQKEADQKKKKYVDMKLCTKRYNWNLMGSD